MLKIQRKHTKLLHKYFFSTIELGEKRILFPLAFGASLDLIRRVDTNFQTDRNLSTDILQNKQATLQAKKAYLGLLKHALSTKPNEASKYVEKKLLAKIKSSIQELNENNLVVEISDGVNIFGDENEILKLIEASPVGSMRVRNVDINREKNLYIHQYILDRIEDTLDYTKKPERKQATPKGTPVGKVKQMQEEMIETFEKEEPLSGWRYYVKNVADKLGFPTDERGYELPKPVEGIKGIRDKMFSKVGSEDFILVEDYEIVSQFGIIVKDKSTGVVYGNYNPDFKSFRQIIRVEKVHDPKDAPSVWRDKPYLLTDIDYMLRGNPHALVKNFVGTI